MLIKYCDVGQFWLVEEIFGGQRDGPDHLDEQLERKQETNVVKVPSKPDSLK